MKKLIKSIIAKLGYTIASKYQIERANAFFHLKNILQRVQVATIFDVGAATGEFCLEFQKLFPGASIHAFEPQPEFFSILNRHSSGSLKTNNFVLSEMTGELEFFVTSGKESSSLIKPNITGTEWDQYLGVTQKTSVLSDTIDGYCTHNRIDRINLLKLDVQGAELQVLKGAEKLLAQGGVDLIYSEVLFMPFYEGQPLYHDVAQYLSKFNYKLYNIYNCVYTNNSVLTWGDAIFVTEALYEEILHIQSKG